MNGKNSEHNYRAIRKIIPIERTAWADLADGKEDRFNLIMFIKPSFIPSSN